MVANLFGFLVAISLTPALNKQTKESTDVTFLVMFVNLALSLLFLIFGLICGGSPNDKRSLDKSSSLVVEEEEA